LSGLKENHFNRKTKKYEGCSLKTGSKSMQWSIVKKTFQEAIAEL
jgi:hypothetical protein